MKTTRYNDGTAIPTVTTATQWAGLGTPAYCWYNDSISNKATYGALYNWYAVNTKKLAPAGWHVPTDAEWTTLTTFLSGVSVAGGMLKEKGTAHWLNPNTDATDAYGFSALPGGYRDYGGSFYNVGSFGSWWSATAFDAPYSWSRNMVYYYAYVYRNFDDDQYGYSVRLVRD